VQGRSERPGELEKNTQYAAKSEYMRLGSTSDDSLRAASWIANRVCRAAKREEIQEILGLPGGQMHFHCTNKAGSLQLEHY